MCCDLRELLFILCTLALKEGSLYVFVSSTKCSIHICGLVHARILTYSCILERMCIVAWVDIRVNVAVSSRCGAFVWWK